MVDVNVELGVSALEVAVAPLAEILNSHVISSGAPLEGNICYLHQQTIVDAKIPFAPEKAPMRQNLATLSRRSNWLLEIGFNAGHSAAIAFTANPSLRYSGVDLGQNSYSRKCALELKTRFGDNFDVTFADSRIVLSKGINAKGGFPDLIHVDGGHDFSTARLDLLSVAALCGPDTLVLVDDCHGPWVTEAVMTVLAQGLFEAVSEPDIVLVPEQVLLRLRRQHASPETAEKRAVLVAATDAASMAEFKVTGGAMRAYAARIGADFILFDGTCQGRDAYFPKLAALDAAAHYDRVLVLDTDIHVLPDAPDLFAMVPADRPALYLESGVIDRSLWCDIVGDVMGDGATMRRNLYANSGVMLLPQKIARQVAASRHRERVVAHPRYEQTMVNAVLHEQGFPVFNLSQLFNRIVAWGGEWESAAWFHHYAGWSPDSAIPWYWRRMADGNGEVWRTEATSGTTFRLTHMAADIARRLGGWVRFISPSELQVLGEGVRLQSKDGIHVALGVQAGATGWIYGPYTTLEPGRYVADFLFSPLTPEGELPVEAATNGGLTDVSIHDVAVLSELPPQAQAKAVIRHSFEIAREMHGVEFRIKLVGKAFDFFGVWLTKA